MKNNEFFKALQGKEEITRGEIEALNAWNIGMWERLDFPFARDSIPMFNGEKDVSDFLKSIEAAGFKKFGYHARSTMGVENIVAFTKAGWKLTGVFEYGDEYRFEGLVFENLQ